MCLLLAFILMAAVGCARGPKGDAPKSPGPKSKKLPVRINDVATGLEFPWALAFLPDGRMLVTERVGRLRILTSEGEIGSLLTGLPSLVSANQGGLLDVAVDPQFPTNRAIYISYTEPDNNGRNGTSVARAVLGNTGLENVRVIYRQEPKVVGSAHFGSRLVFRHDGTLFVTQGERQEYRARAQDLRSGLGKIVRINTDGSIPHDNPFVGRSGALPEIWSYGHRNVQAPSLHPETGELWTAEHGARGGDELNNPQAGKNYGWPIISYGTNYDGTPIGAGITAKAGMEAPAYYWDPVIAPSGMIFYTADKLPLFKSGVLISSLRGGIVHLTLDRSRVVSEARYLQKELGRTRHVAQGPDGLVYLVVDGAKGRVVRLDPE
jgi:glucose/arabinose dehydrogenase